MKEEATTTRRATVCVDSIRAGVLCEYERGARYELSYDPEYKGAPISLTMPLRSAPYTFRYFPPFFDGLLPEGVQLEALLRSRKIDKDDVFSQLLAVGSDLVGNVTVISSA
jgi:serine/threonine-protein kinase HipA